MLAFFAFLHPLLLLFFAPVLPDQKKAYSAHYQGSLLYAEGQIRQANQKFSRAYSILPRNFYFALSYGLSEGRLGNDRKGLDLIQEALLYLDPRDPDFAYKYATARFLRVMIHCYNQDYGEAYNSLIATQRVAPDTLRLQSLIEHTLGYLTVTNQTLNRDRSNELPPHYHVRQHDLEKAHTHFEKALDLDPEQPATLRNYRMLCDTLGLPPRFAAAPEKDKKAKVGEFTFLYMHEKIIQDLRLDRYPELAFLVDVSGSMVSQQVICMNDDRFNVMKDLGRKIVDALPATTRLGLGTIGGDCPDPPAQWAPVGQLSRKEMHNKLRFLIPDGTTPLLTMLRETPSLFADSSQARKSIFLISDGANTCREPGLDICLFAEELARKNIAVNVLTFLNSSYNNTSAFSEYLCLAEKTGGQIIYLDNYRCFFQPFHFDLLETCYLELPVLPQSDCWGAGRDDLWMFDQEE